MDKISKQDLYDVVNDPGYEFDKFVSLITKHIEIQIPEEYGAEGKKDALVDYVFNNLPEQKKNEQSGDEEDKTLSNKCESAVPDSSPMGKSNIIEGTEGVREVSDISTEERSVSPDNQQVCPENQPLRPKITINLKSTSVDKPRDVTNDSVVEEVEKTGPASVDLTPPSPPLESSNAKQFKDRKSHIIWLCKESKYRQVDIVKVIDDSWGYTVEGKTSKTRVAKTIKDLKEASLVTIDGNSIVFWRG